MKFAKPKQFKPLKDLGEGMEVAPGLVKNPATAIARKDLSYHPDEDEMKPKFPRTRNMFKTGY